MHSFNMDNLDKMLVQTSIPISELSFEHLKEFFADVLVFLDELYGANEQVSYELAYAWINQMYLLISQTEFTHFISLEQSYMYICIPVSYRDQIDPEFYTMLLPRDGKMPHDLINAIDRRDRVDINIFLAGIKFLMALIYGEVGLKKISYSLEMDEPYVSELTNILVQKSGVSQKYLSYMIWAD